MSCGTFEQQPTVVGLAPGHVTGLVHPVPRTVAAAKSQQGSSRAPTGLEPPGFHRRPLKPRLRPAFFT